MFFSLQVLAVKSNEYEQLNQIIFSILVIGLPVLSNLTLKKISRRGCSISWIGAIIHFKTTTSLIKKRYILKQEL